jgi:hypothetical protein
MRFWSKKSKFTDDELVILKDSIESNIRFTNMMLDMYNKALQDKQYVDRVGVIQQQIAEEKAYITKCYTILSKLGLK